MQNKQQYCLFTYRWVIALLLLATVCSAKTPLRTLNESDVFEYSQQEIQIKKGTTFAVQFDFSPSMAQQYQYKVPKHSIFQWLGETSKNKFKKDGDGLTRLACCMQVGTWQFVANEIGRESLIFIYTQQDFPPVQHEFKIRVVP